MRNIPLNCLMTVAILLPGAMVRPAAASDIREASIAAPVSAHVPAAHARLPAGVDVYARTDVGNGQCIVGTQSDEGSLSERPVVYFAKAAGEFAWHVQLRIPKNVYQGRATHCVAWANALYVLVQMDTDSHVLTNQTLLEVVRLDNRTGLITASSGFIGPTIAGPYTAWVEDGTGNFKCEHGKLVISGKFDLMSDWSDPGAHGSKTRTFVIALPEDLHE